MSTMDKPTALADLLRDLRTRAGLAVRDVQRALGVSRATAYHWEGPDSRPTVEHLHQLLDLFGASDGEKLLAWELRACASPEEAA